MSRYAQLTLDGMESVPTAKIMALHQVEQNADPHWITSASQAVHDLARLHDEFTTDAVWARLASHDIPEPREPRAMGAVMRSAAIDEIIEPTGRWEQSTREVNHQRPVAIWRSLVR